MLKVDKLKSEIQKAFEETLPTALEQAIRTTCQNDSALGTEMAKRFGEVVTDMVSEPLAERLAAAIDYHVRSASISGTIITVGSMVTQSAMINSPSAITNGRVPNSLRID